MNDTKKRQKELKEQLKKDNQEIKQRLIEISEARIREGEHRRAKEKEAIEGAKILCDLSKLCRTDIENPHLYMTRVANEIVGWKNSLFYRIFKEGKKVIIDLYDYYDVNKTNKDVHYVTTIFHRTRVLKNIFGIYSVYPYPQYISAISNFKDFEDSKEYLELRNKVLAYIPDFYKENIKDSSKLDIIKTVR